MERIDWIIVGIGVVALVATTFGVLYEDELTGSDDIGFVTAERDYDVPTTSAFPTTTTMTRDAGINATGADIGVTVNFAGTAIAPQGGASIRVVVTAPDGNETEQTLPMAIANAANGGGASPVTFTFNGLSFGQTPEATSTEDASNFDANLTWMDGYSIEVFVTSPGDPFTGGVGPTQASYSYTASATITERYFMHTILSTEIQGGQ